MKYPTLDASIRETYARRSTANLKKSLYDSYIRAIRWASNRVLRSEQGGLVCYVSNGGYIDGNTADGLRKTLADEFHHIYVYNLRGNTRTSGEQARKEGGQIFGPGSRNTVAILFLIKLPGAVELNELHYKDIGDFLDRYEKLRLVDEATLESLGWETIIPNAAGDWINQQDEAYESYMPIAADDTDWTIFGMRSRGVLAARDAWLFGASADKTSGNVLRMARNYNSELERIGMKVRTVQELRNEALRDARQIKWDGTLETRFLRGEKLDEKTVPLVQAMYRPFFKQSFAFVPQLINRTYRMREIFPIGETNIGFQLVGLGTPTPFSALMSESLTEVAMFGAGSNGQIYPRYSYTEPDANSLFDQPERVDNITDWALEQYQGEYGSQVTKDDIFFYVYGLLHSTEYRERYAADLKKQLPRIPMVPGCDRFEAFVAAGRKLSELHIGYEEVEPYPLTEHISVAAPSDEYERFAVQKMKYGGKAGHWDKTTIKYNSFIDIIGIPEEAQRYMLGSRSALDWIVERYQVKTDKASGIVNDPNDWSREHEQPRYIIDLIGRITRVSLETMKIVGGLPDLGLSE